MLGAPSGVREEMIVMSPTEPFRWALRFPSRSGRSGLKVLIWIGPCAEFLARTNPPTECVLPVSAWSQTPAARAACSERPPTDLDARCRGKSQDLAGLLVVNHDIRVRAIHNMARPHAAGVTGMILRPRSGISQERSQDGHILCQGHRWYEAAAEQRERVDTGIHENLRLEVDSRVVQPGSLDEFRNESGGEKAPACRTAISSRFRRNASTKAISSQTQRGRGRRPINARSAASATPLEALALRFC